MEFIYPLAAYEQVINRFQDVALLHLVPTTATARDLIAFKSQLFRVSWSDQIHVDTVVPSLVSGVVESSVTVASGATFPSSETSSNFDTFDQSKKKVR